MILVVAGTRPEAIKVAPLLKALKSLKEDYRLVWSGQHSDYNMSRVFFRELQIDEPDVFVKIRQGQESLILASTLSVRLKELIDKLKPSAVYALGDTTTVLASSLASHYSRVPFVHDEAGMRSYDNSMEEEINRKFADTIAKLRLCPTKLGVMNLFWEGFSNSSIRLVGSSVVDSLLYVQQHARRIVPDVLARHGLEKNRYILLTVHRRQILDEVGLTKLVTIIVSIGKKHRDMKIVFPVHPHTRKKLRHYGLQDPLLREKNVLLTEPLGYLDFLSLLENSILVITDSGGVQEEAFILGKGTITLRHTTEWPETVLWGSNILTGLNPKVASKAYDILSAKTIQKPSLARNPLGDGRSGYRVARLLVDARTKSSLNRPAVATYDNVVPIAIRQLKAGLAVHFNRHYEAKFVQIDRANREMSLSLRDMAKNVSPSKSRNVLEVNWSKLIQ